MINWENVIYDIGAATRDFNDLEVKSMSVEPVKARPDFLPLRQELLEARDLVFEKLGLDNSNKLDYSFDLSFGLKLYQILNENIGFTNRVASNDDVWRYLSVCVVPDIVHSRWGLNESHFYQMPRRIWLKTIWWYIHLSWRNEEAETYELLKENTTDTMLQLVERPGIGYYTEMYREIMLQYSYHEDSSRNLFRRVLKLNTAKILTTSPELVEGGIEKYVESLYNSAGEL